MRNETESGTARVAAAHEEGAGSRRAAPERSDRPAWAAPEALASHAVRDGRRAS